MNNFADSLQDNIFSTISNVCSNNNIEVYVIGGFVRDLIIRRPSKDVDVVVVGSGLEAAKQVALAFGSKTQVKYFKNFGTAMIRHNDWIIEFVGARKESYDRGSRNPVVEDGTLSDDQNRRDFTINAMSLSLQKNNFGELLDPFNGIADIESRIIRTPLDPDITFSDDPLRMMRAIRFACQLGFDIFEDTFDAISRNKERIKIISAERVIDEINLIMMSPVPSIGFELLDLTGLLQIIFPKFTELKGVEVINHRGHKDNFYHTLEVLDNIALKSNNIWLRWAALLHDIAKPATKRYDKDAGWTFHGHEFKGAKMIPSIFSKLKLPLNEKMRYVQKLVQLHLRPIVLAQDIVTDSAVRRLLFDAGDDIDDLMMLCDADITSKNETKVKRYLDNFQLVRKKLKEVEGKDHIRNWQPPITGEIIMETFDLKPSKNIGIIKDAIREAILEGEIGNNYDDAFTYMLKVGKERNLRVKT
jgi:poly(A) polymerase